MRADLACSSPLSAHRLYTALDSWHKVKIKTTDATAAPAIGLVPASYLAPSVPLRAVTALYDYTPAVGEDGQLENDEEMEIAEGEQLELLEEEEEWILVQRADGGGAGFVPASYVEVSSALLRFAGATLILSL